MLPVLILFINYTRAGVPGVTCSNPVYSLNTSLGLSSSKESDSDRVVYLSQVQYVVISHNPHLPAVMDGTLHFRGW